MICFARRAETLHRAATYSAPSSSPAPRSILRTVRAGIPAICAPLICNVISLPSIFFFRFFFLFSASRRSPGGAQPSPPSYLVEAGLFFWEPSHQSLHHSDSEDVVTGRRRDSLEARLQTSISAEGDCARLHSAAKAAASHQDRP